MNHLRLRTYFLPVLFFLLSTSLILGGCANKAKVIRVGATQFENESLAAIYKIDEFRRNELETTPLSSMEATDFFVESVKKSTIPITPEVLETLGDPFKTEAPGSEPEWQAFLKEMKHQYTTLAATFTSLEKGSLLAASKVKKTIPFINKLIAQLVSFANYIEEHPADFLRERASVAAQLERVRSQDTDDEVKTLKLKELERQLREIMASEKQITRETIEYLLKAATIGVELRKLLADYDNLTVDDIAEGLNLAFQLAGDIPGLNVTGLKTKTDSLIIQIKSDMELERFFNNSLSQIENFHNVRKP